VLVNRLLLEGLGLVLLGLTVMGEALRHLAGRRVQRTLLHVTVTPARGALTGALVTALLQSSSATTVMVVGFVAAGMIPFDNAVGIILGANLGSTALGWLLALVGLGGGLVAAVLPLLLLGSILRLLLRGWPALFGQALAGFSLLFLGMERLQDGFSSTWLLDHVQHLDPGQWPGPPLLVLLGLASILICQSSGLGVGATLAALASGQISLLQAGFLVIGMDAGSTMTALFASLGTGLAARRTAMVHLLFNLLSALVALLVLPAFTTLWGARPSLLGLTSFHSGYNLLTVLLVLPFSSGLAQLTRHLLPSRGDPCLEGLEAVAGEPPEAALAMAARSLERVFTALAGVLKRGLRSTGPSPAELETLQEDLDRIERFLDRLDVGSLSSQEAAWLVHLLHALDHGQRLHERCDEEPERAATVRTSNELAPQCRRMLSLLDALAPDEPGGDGADPGAAARGARDLERSIDGSLEACRALWLERVASGAVDVEWSRRHLQAIRWLRRVSRHLARGFSHLEQARLAAADAQFAVPQR
jgi:phosphate:Na+ symporter